MKQNNEHLNWEDYKKMDFTQNVREFIYFYFLKYTYLNTFINSLSILFLNCFIVGDQ